MNAKAIEALPRVLVLLIALVSSGLFAQEIRMDSRLRKDVYFWELIFGKYTSQDCVFHDSEHLDVIYGIVRIKGKNSDQRIQSYRRSIVRTLIKIRDDIALDDVFERRVSAAIPREFKNERFLQEAISRVRCQQGVADSFVKSLERSRNYIPKIKRQLKRYGLPLDLAYLPHLESGFNVRAWSKVGARGLWQLMPAVAKENGLRVGRSRDDRVHVEKSTKVALKILRRNYSATGSWPLAITGYNYGINGISRAVRQHGTRDFVRLKQIHRTGVFGFAARNFYPSFLAARNLAIRAEHVR